MEAVGRSPCGERGLKLCVSDKSQNLKMSLPVRGAWVEMSYSTWSRRTRSCRSPCGERGLKSTTFALQNRALLSLPVRGAWVEMSVLAGRPNAGIGRSPCGERGLKLYPIGGEGAKVNVAPRAGSVG